MTDAARRQAIQSKALTRCILARYCGEDVAPASLRFAYGEHGKPALVAVESDSDRASSSEEEDSAASSLAPPPPIRFSVSHCAHLLALAVTTAPPGSRESKRKFPAGAAVPFAAPHEVGVDCEDETRRTSGSCDRLASRWLSDVEAALLARVEGERERAATFMRLWTLKEAYVKALGTGIAAHPLKGFDVEFLTSDDREDEDAEDDAEGTEAGSAEARQVRGRESSSRHRKSSLGSGTPGGTPRAARVRLTERSGSSARERSAWARSAGSWRFALVRPRRGANEIASVCAWIEEGGGEEGDGEGARGPRGAPRGAPGMVVRWTVPGRGGDADVEGEHELIAASG
jgi:4'-phosphopantetheinyl transferase